MGTGVGKEVVEIVVGQEKLPAGHLPLPREQQAVTQGGGHRPPVWWAGVRIQEYKRNIGVEIFNPHP